MVCFMVMKQIKFKTILCDKREQQTLFSIGMLVAQSKPKEISFLSAHLLWLRLYSQHTRVTKTTPFTKVSSQQKR